MSQGKNGSRDKPEHHREGRRNGHAREGYGRAWYVPYRYVDRRFLLEQQGCAEMVHGLRYGRVHVELVNIAGRSKGSNAKKGESQVSEARDYGAQHGN